MVCPKDSTVAAAQNVTLYAHWQAAVSYRLVLDANGGSVNPSSKIVVKGDVYGELPTPGLYDNTFMGWYTEKTGGTEVTALSVVGDTATLYARWKPLHTYYNINYNANGGTINGSTVKRVTAGETYGTLAVPQRAGYCFTGWYTRSAGGEQITADSLVTLTQDVTLYAHWTANTYRITFNANGGTVSLSTKTVTYDKAYGALPVAERDGYDFSGWSVSASSSTFVTSDTICKITADQTLYARWQAKQYGNYTLESLSYSFGNNNRAYGYASNYKIPLERYQLMYGNTQQAYTYYQQASVWGGNCFGMSSTSAMLLTADNGINLTDFRSGASKASSLTVGDSNAALGVNLTQFIEAMQISQKKSTNAGEVTFAMTQDTGENAVDVEAEDGEQYEIPLYSMAEGDTGEVSVTGTGEGGIVSVASRNGEVALEGEGALLEIDGEVYPDVAVTASAGTGGAISNAGRKEYQYKSYQNYTITPSAGYKIQDVLVDGVSMGAVNQYGFAELIYPVCFRSAQLCRMQVQGRSTR